MITRTRSLLSVAALAVLTTSCLGNPMGIETTGPDPLYPVFFEAVSANDHPLPAFINADGSAQGGVSSRMPPSSSSRPIRCVSS
ncbi:MAG: hypothetical protein JWN79_2464 [Gemmatimonadetes bacterium]|nr:hypothetical protein [Gemmatimonadota bacterium]